MNVTNTAGGPAVSLLLMVRKAFKKTWNLNNRLVTCIMPQFSIQLWKTLLPKPFWTICSLQVGHFPSSRFIFLLSELELLQEEEEQQFFNRKIRVQLHEEFCADNLWPPLSTEFLLARRSRTVFDCYLEVCDTAYYHPHLRIRIQTSAWCPEVDELQLKRRQWDAVFLLRFNSSLRKPEYIHGETPVQEKCVTLLHLSTPAVMWSWEDSFHSCAQKKHQVEQGDLNFYFSPFPKKVH